MRDMIRTYGAHRATIHWLGIVMMSDDDTYSPYVYSYEEYVADVRLSVLWKGWRPGQSAFNVLHELRPDLADKIRSTQLDPFYHDERLMAFYKYVYEHWEDE